MDPSFSRPGITSGSFVLETRIIASMGWSIVPRLTTTEAIDAMKRLGMMPMISCDFRCVRCKNHEHHELWVPACQVAVCGLDIQEMRAALVATGNATLVAKIDAILQRGGTGRELPDGTAEEDLRDDELDG